MVRSFLSRLFGSDDTPDEPSGPPPDPLAPGERVYAIGDLHGRSDLLDAMHDKIREDLADRPPAAAQIVYLGDYVDRGPDSAGVLQRLAEPASDLPPAKILTGNHEWVMREFLAGKDVADGWREFGGFETMRSYGVEPTSIPGRRWAGAAREELLHAMPTRHRRMIETIGFSYDRPPYFFCHAGVRPGVPLERQDPQDLIWIRKEFLRSDEDFGRIVVHGHTPVSAPDRRANRINLDTGAYATGRLTCAALETGDIRIFQTGSD